MTNSKQVTKKIRDCEYNKKGKREREREREREKEKGRWGWGSFFVYIVMESS